MNNKQPANRKTVVALLKERISSGHFPSGSRLPSIRKLALMFGVSTRTANLAVMDLIQDGLFVSVPRKGVYVRSAPEDSLAPIELNAESAKPKAERIAEDMSEQIGRGDLRVGEALPLHKTLRFRFGTSPATLKKALALLEKRRLIHRSGNNFVVGPPKAPGSTIDQPVHVLRGWSATNRQHVYIRTNLAFASSLELELSRHGVTYLGEKSPAHEDSRASRISARQEVFGYFYPCTSTVVRAVAEDSISAMERELTRINRIGVPVVLFNCQSIHVKFPNLSFRSYRNLFPLEVDFTIAGVEAGAYLAGMGHRKIAFFGFSKGDWNTLRYNALSEGMNRATGDQATVLPFQAQYAKSNLNRGRRMRQQETFENFSQFTRKEFGGFEFQRKDIVQNLVAESLGMATVDLHYRILNPYFEKALQNSDITAWVGADFTVTMVAAEFLKAKGVSIPGDISVLAIDDNRGLTERGITGCDMQMDRMAYLAAHCLLGDLPVRRNKHGAIEEIPRIVDRGSVGRVTQIGTAASRQEL